MARGADAPAVNSHRDETDAEALSGVLARDPETFGRLFDRHAGQAHAFCGRRSPEPEDVLSMVFLEAWRCHDRAVLVDRSLRPWLLGIARNVVRTHGRSSYRYRAALNRYVAAEVPPAHDLEDEVVRTVDAPGLQAGVAAALATLPRRDHESPSSVCCTA
jgi:DNA-directed RNA polymerase specialized sigma24 family protein